MDDLTQKIRFFLQSEYNIKIDLLKHINTGVINTNYICKSGNKKYILKLYNFKSANEIYFEIEVLEFLKRKSFPSPRLLPSINGEFILTFQKKPCVLFAYIEGSNLQTMTPKIMEQVAILQASMHNALKNFVPVSIKSTWDPQELKSLLKNNKNTITSSDFPDGLKFMNFAERELEKYTFPEDLPKGVTHQDIKPENILVEGDNVKGIVDFDNSYFGFLLFDIATTIIWSCFKSERFDKKMFLCFINSYSKERLLTELEKKYLQDSIKFRLAREVFIGPFITAHFPSISKDRADYFMRLYEKFEFIQ